jgi:lipopolysaccharide transport system permease protein
MSSVSKLPLLVIDPPKGWVPLKLNELWNYRELVYFLTWRDIRVRYKQTALGAAWAIIQPLFAMVIFTMFFGRLAKVPSDGIPYPIFAFAGLVPWNFFANGLSHCSDSLVSSANLIKKVYFPRLAIPLSTVLAGIVDFSISFLVLLAMMIYFQVAFSWKILWIPAFLLLSVTTALGVGLWLSALNVQYRDVRYTVPFLVQLWMYSTPIAYPSSLLSEPWRTVYGLNPMVGVVEGFRWCLLGAKTEPGPMIAVSAVMAILILISGSFYFRRTEKRFADVV